MRNSIEKSEIPKYKNNIEEYKLINEKTKKNVDEILDKLTSKFSLECSIGNMNTIISCYHTYLTTFLDSINTLINDIQKNFIFKEQKTIFHKVFYSILLENQLIFKKMSSELLQIRVNLSTEVEQSSIKYSQSIDMYAQFKENFGKKYNENFENYKKYIETYENIEKYYLQSENGIFDWGTSEKFDIKTPYEQYIKTNEELNNYCKISLPVAIEIYNNYEKNKLTVNNYIKQLTLQIINIFNIFTNNPGFSNYKKGIENQEENKIIDDEKFDLSNIEFPLIKYNFSIMNTIRIEESDNSQNINISNTEKLLKILERIIEDYPKINDELNLEEEKNKFIIREFMTNLIEKNEVGKKLNLVEQILKEEFYRNYFLKYINKKRSKGLLEIKNPKAMKIFGSLMKEIMKFNEEDKNIETTKLIFIMSQTYFYINKNGKQIYLTQFIKDNHLLKNSDYWLSFLSEMVKLDFEKEIKRSHVDENSLKTNISFSKIMTIFQNMNECEVSKNVIKTVIDKAIEKYNISKDLSKQIFLAYNNVSEKEITEFDPEKEII